MIFELLLVILILFVTITWASHRSIVNHRESSEKLTELRKTINEIVGGIKPLDFNLKESTDKTYIEGNNIFLVLKNPRGKFYDRNTLIYAVLHEITHLITGRDHDPIFDKMEKKILLTAQKKGYFDSSLPIDPSYPCEL